MYEIEQFCPEDRGVCEDLCACVKNFIPCLPV